MSEMVTIPREVLVLLRQYVAEADPYGDAPMLLRDIDTALAAGEAKPEHDPARAVQVWGETLTTPQDKARFLARYFRQFERSGHAIDGQPLHLFTADVLDALAAGEARPVAGWKMMPMEPTPEIVARIRSHSPLTSEYAALQAYYAAIDAAPPQPAVTDEMVEAACSTLYTSPFYAATDRARDKVRAALVAAMKVGSGGSGA